MNSDTSGQTRNHCCRSWLKTLAGMLTIVLWFSVSHSPASDRICSVQGDHNYPPYEYLDDLGKPVGFNVELFGAVARIMGLDYKLSLGPWKDVRKALENGEIDAVTGMFFSTDRDTLVDFSLTHSMVDHGLFVRKGSSVSGFESAIRGSVLVQKGDIIQDILVRMAIPGQVITVNDQEDALRLLAVGSHDCALLNKLQGEYFIKKLGLTNVVAVGGGIFPEKYCFAVSQGREELLARLNQGLTIIKNTGEYDRIYDRWFGIYDRNQLMWRSISVVAWILVPFVLGFLILGTFILRRTLARRTRELENEVSHRRRMETELARHHELKLILDSSPIAIFYMDRQGQYSYVNQAMTEAVGLSPESIKGRKVREIFPDDSAARMEVEDMDVMESGEPRIGSMFQFRRNQEDRWLRITRVPLRDSGSAVVGLVGFSEDITFQKRIEQELKSSEERYRSLFETTQAVMLLVDSNTGNILDANPRACSYYGYSKSEITSMTVFQINCLEPENVLAEMARARAEERNHFQFRHRLASGEVRDVEVYSTPLILSGRQTLFSIIHDVTQRIQAEIAVRESEQYYRSMMEAVPDLVYICSQDRRVEYMNPAMASWAGVGQDKDISCHELVFGKKEPCDKCLMNGLGPEGQKRNEPDIVTLKDARQYLVMTTSIRHVDGTYSQLTMFRDITVLKEMESELIKAKKMESLGSMSGGIAHDFNNLLTIINGYLELSLMEVNPSDRIHDLIAKAVKECGLAKDLIWKFLTLAQSERFSPRAVSMEEMIRDAAGSVMGGSTTQIDIITDDRLWEVTGDPWQIREILGHVLENAREATKDKGKIVLSSANVDNTQGNAVNGSGIPPGMYVHVSVEDTGKGIQQSDLPRIFDPYFSTKTRGSKKGMGLGLTLVLSMLDRNNGFIRVSSKPGQGTQVHIYFKKTPSP
ncbi:MAG: PAS domain S-box protein [Pseudomonadota bacterium]